MNYKDFNDYELLDLAYGDENVNDIILYKYRPLVVNIATKYIKYSSGGLDLNDLVQEGLLGLNDAINSYREDKDTNFGTFAKICIERRIKSLIRSTKTIKNKILNESISIENEDDEIIDKYVIDNKNNPLERMSEAENFDDFVDKIVMQLTDLEREVFELKLNGLNYKEIANILEKDTKVIDNAIQRIKNKIKNIID